MITISVTDEQRANLITLSNFLKSHSPSPKFNMHGFMEVSDDVKLKIGDVGSEAYLVTPELYTHCGTTACAVGHGPLAGIAVKPFETWGEYSGRVFGTHLYGDQLPGSTALFEYLFGMWWEHIDNTPEGAAGRIDYYLKNNGIDDNWRDQLYKKAPLTYKEIA